MSQRRCQKRSPCPAARDVAGLWFAVAVGIVLLPAAATSGETFVIKTGGELTGKWLNRQDSPRKTYEIETASGDRVTLAASAVDRVIVLSPAQTQYEKIRPSYPDTVAGHETLAEWCLERKLRSERKRHLQRIIELDADHKQARAALGYREVRGRWMTRDEEMAHQGKRMYKGRYRTAQEIEILEAKEKREKAERRWFRELSKLRGGLDRERGYEEAEQSIREIDDPAAVRALGAALSREEDQSVRLLYLEALSSIGSRGAIDELVHWSIVDEDEEIRQTAVEYVVKSEHGAVVKVYIKLLAHKDNFRINRAAYALGQLKNPEAIEPLIDALVTTHRRLLDPGANSGQVSASFSPDGGGGISTGARGPKYEKRRLQNPFVLTALVALTDVTDFGYDEVAWQRWYTQHRRTNDFNSRRD